MQEIKRIEDSDVCNMAFIKAKANEIIDSQNLMGSQKEDLAVSLEKIASLEKENDDMKKQLRQIEKVLLTTINNMGAHTHSPNGAAVVPLS